MERHKAEHSNIVIESRKKLSASGVFEVTGFDETQIEAETAAGLLLIRGEKLHIDSFDAGSGELVMTGRVDGFVYTEKKPKQGLFSRILK